MRLLAIDASTWWGGAALVETTDGAIRVVAEVGLHVEDSHAARLLPAVDALLAAAAWPRSSIDAFASTRGPGSFTGIRVALGLLAGWSLSAARPCVGVGTLPAMAEAHGPAAADRVPLVDAGRGEVYGARFDPAASPPRERRAPWVGDPASALEQDVETVIFGGGAVRYAQHLRDAGWAGVAGSAPTSVAAGAGRIALALLATGSARPQDLSPLYVRPADAEVPRR
jgi:tRNA threonylcarbamoyladenosine biosynthesis protein TsaB